MDQVAALEQLLATALRRIAALEAALASMAQENADLHRQLAKNSELRPFCRTLGYFTPVRERGPKWDNIDAIIQTIIRQLQLSGYMSLVRRKAALPRSLGSLGRS